MNIKPNKGHSTELRSGQGNQRPRRQDYQADWTYTSSLEEHTDRIEALNQELIGALRVIRNNLDVTSAQRMTIAEAALAKVQP